MSNFRRALPIFALAALLGAGSAHAVTTKYREQTTRWDNGDKCAKLAIEKYPDFTPEDNAKRDAYERRCRNSRDVPGRASSSSGK